MYPVNLAVLLCTVISYISGAKISKRIIGGYNAKEGHYPWAVSIKGVHPKSRSITFCGSTIVTDQWLLSAAHCFWTDPKQKTHLMDPANWQAQAGNTQIELAPEKPGDSLVGKLMDNSPVHSFSDFLDALLEFFRGKQRKNETLTWHARAEKIVLHPKYHPDDLEYDIALMKVSEPFPLQNSRISLAKLPTGKETKDWPPADSMTTFVGWGCRRSNTGPSSTLQVVALKVVPHDVCAELYNYGAGLNKEHEFCAGYYKSKVGICAGDSGGGLIYLYHGQPIVVGVASATHAEHPQSYPGLFTRVASFTDWIQKTISENS